MKFLFASVAVTIANAAVCTIIPSAKVTECMNAAPTTLSDCDSQKWGLWCVAHGDGNCEFDATVKAYCALTLAAVPGCDATCNGAMALAASPLALAAVLYNML